MIYVEKAPCPEDIQENFAKQKAKPEWNDIPEEPNGEQADVLRREFFDKEKCLSKNSMDCAFTVCQG